MVIIESYKHAIYHSSVQTHIFLLRKRPTITEDEDTHVIQTSSELTAMVVQPILLRGSFEEGFDSDSLEGEFL